MALLLIGCGEEKVDPDSLVVAKGRSFQIRKGEVDLRVRAWLIEQGHRLDEVPDHLLKAFTGQVLDGMVQHRLILLNCPEDLHELAKEEAQARWKLIINQGQSLELVEDALKMGEVSREDFLQHLEERSLVDLFMERGIGKASKVPHEEIQRLYSNHPSQFTVPVAKYRMIRMIVKGKSEKSRTWLMTSMESARERLVGGERFLSVLSDLRKKGLVAPDSGKEFMVRKSAAMSKREEVAFGLEVREVSEILEDEESIFLLEGLNGDLEILPLEEVANSIRESLLRQAQVESAFMYLQTLRGDENVEIFEVTKVGETP